MLILLLPFIWLHIELYPDRRSQRESFLPREYLCLNHPEIILCGAYAYPPASFLGYIVRRLYIDCRSYE